MKFPLQWTVHIANPEAAKTILMKTDKFPKYLGLFDVLGDSSPFVRFFGYTNLAVVNGDQWKQQRKLIGPVFHRSMPVQLFGSVMPKAFKNIEDKQGTIMVPELMHRLTLDVIGLTAFGFDFCALEDPQSQWLKTYEVVRNGLRSPVPLIIPKFDKYLKYILPGRRRILEATDKLNGLLLAMAEEKRSQLKQDVKLQEKDDHEKDLLTLLLEAENRGEGQATNDQLRDIQRKAREEAISILGDDPVDVFPSIAECKQMKYIDMVIKENLRTSGPASVLGARKAQEDVVVGGLFVPKGTLLSVDVYNIHHNPEVWNNPELFDPERFSEGGEYETHNTSGLTWIPFSQGGRICIAMNFSLAEQRVVMAMLLRKYEWDLPEDSIHKYGIKMDHFQPTAPKSLQISFRKRY
ncbi:cytochrome P450-dit2 [Apophysomyces sp. BC1034]|nr:cytochrome P450-dit2 [Apophysomyces sp. BC1021]KAG0193526.1 cytochrome P450-dit2 [Apophysomyces sp. BC1034]